MLPCNEVFDKALGRVTWKFVCIRKKSSSISQNASVRLSAVVGEPVDQSTLGKLKSPVIIMSAIPEMETLKLNRDI